MATYRVDHYLGGAWVAVVTMTDEGTADSGVSIQDQYIAMKRQTNFTENREVDGQGIRMVEVEE